MRGSLFPKVRTIFSQNITRTFACITRFFPPFFIHSYLSTILNLCVSAWNFFHSFLPLSFGFFSFFVYGLASPCLSSHQVYPFLPWCPLLYGLYYFYVREPSAYFLLQGLSLCLVKALHSNKVCFASFLFSLHSWYISFSVAPIFLRYDAKQPCPVNSWVIL